MTRMPDFIREAIKANQDINDAVLAQLCLDKLNEYPEDRDFILAYAVIYLFSAKKNEECIALAIEALPGMKIKECINDTNRFLGFAYKANGQQQEVITLKLKELEEADEKDKFAEYEEICEMFDEQGDVDNAIKYYEEYITYSKGNVDSELFEKLAQHYETKKDYKNSAKYFERAAAEISAESYWHWQKTGRALALDGKQEEALFYFKVSHIIKPDAWTHYFMGTCFHQKGDGYMAMHHYLEALKLKPEFPETVNNIAAFKFENDSDIKGAIEQLEAALKMNPAESFKSLLYANLARIYNLIADYEKHNYYKKKLIEAAGFTAEERSKEEENNDDLI